MPLTVAELIRYLKLFPDDYTIEMDFNYDSGYVNKVDFNDEERTVVLKERDCCTYYE